MKVSLKNIIALVMLAGLIIVMAGTTPVSAADRMRDYTADHLYARGFEVVALDYKNDLVTLEDGVGFLWQVYGCEDWIVGDIAAGIMFDNNTTDTIFDDVIIQLRATGFVGEHFLPDA